MDIICGSNMEGKLTKTDTIRNCMDAAGMTADQCVLAGDTENDAQGEAEAGVPFIAVTYGFRNMDEMKKYPGIGLEKTTKEISETGLDQARNACYDCDTDTQSQLILLKEQSGLNWREFANYFEIPYRTMQDWYLGKRKMPDYLLRLMYYKMKTDRNLGNFPIQDIYTSTNLKNWG